MADYIERKTVLNALSVFNDRVHGNEHFLNGIETAKEIVDKTLSADVATVLKSHWYWDEDGMDWGIGAWCCDNCKSRAETWWALDKKYNPLRCSGGKFCGNCGAKMNLVI